MSSSSSRSANFTHEQIDLLLDSLEACPQLVSGRLGGKIPTKHHQKLAWEAVAQELNDVGRGGKKNGEQIRCKWNDLKYRTRLKISKLALKINETGEQPPVEERLNTQEKRVLSILGYKATEPLTDSNFDSTTVTLKLMPANIVDFIVGKEDTLDGPVTYVIQENPVDEETENAVEAIETSNSDMLNKIIVQDVRSEYVKENPTQEENGTVSGASKNSWPFAERKLSAAADRTKSSRTRKRKLMEEEEDHFESTAIATQKRMANDISEINKSITDMKNNMNKYLERMDQKFDKMLELLAVALNVEPSELE